MATQSTPSIVASFSESIGSDDMSVALIGPSQGLRQALANSLSACHTGPIKEYSEYPASIDDVPKLFDRGYDIIMIEWDHDPEYTLDLVEAICGEGTATVMVYSEQPDTDMADPDLLKRCMRAGASEFLSVPVAPDAMTEALVRAAARRQPIGRAATDGGRLFVFCGAKGGVGVTSVACTFALALALESKENTLLVDLVLPYGDAALKFGLQPQYSTLDALNSSDRLDPTLLSQLVVKHPSGLSILGATGKPMEYKPERAVIDKLISVARQSFANVVVDAGSQFDVYSREEHFKGSSSVYLVAQAGISEIRNANRLIAQYFGSERTSLKIILNRYEAANARVSDDEIRKALTRAIDWKIPTDQQLLRRMQEPSTPVPLSESPMAVEFLSMARSICGKPEDTHRKKGFSLGKLARTLSFKASNAPNPLRVVPETPQVAEAAATESTPTPETSGDMNANPLGLVRNIQSSNVSTLDDNSPQTRTHLGKTYVKGPDVKWHLHEVQIEELGQEPSVDWEGPEAIVFGTPLSKEQFNARASVPGAFMYVPAEGYVLPVGIHTLWATFTPAPPSGGHSIQSSVSIAVLKATPVLTWPTPLAITCGIPLGDAQLNVTSSIPGEFTYVPELGTVLPAGKHVLSVEFAPIDDASYKSVEAETSIVVLSATPAIVWATPVVIVFGIPLSNIQLCATTEVPGSFAYSPEVGAVLSVGTHLLSVLFSPSDPINYATATAEMSITVAKADPVIAWSTPGQLTYGTKLTETELNAAASTDGRLVYIPPPQSVLSAGSHKLTAVFTPKDRASFNISHAQVPIEVYQAIPRLQWDQPESIPYGTALTDLELNATASVPGTFNYSPAEGKLLLEGTHPLTLRFTPVDTLNYTVAQIGIHITVTKAAPVSVTWNPHSPICYGTPLTADQLCASAENPGEFVYSPLEGTVLPAGKQQLSVVFTPADAQIPPTTVCVDLEISKAKPTVTWSQPENITYGTVLTARQLNASGSVPGDFHYKPQENTCLPAGKHQLAVRFNATDRINYEDVQTGTSITVAKATPHLEWTPSEPVSYGIPLGAAQFKSTSSVAGSFLYSPDLGVVLPIGTHRIFADFKPSDEKNYCSAQIESQLLVQELNDFSSLPEAILEAQVTSQPPTQNAKLVEFRPRQETSDKSGSREPVRTGRDTVSHGAEDLNSQHSTATNGKGVSSANAPEIRTYKGQTYRKGADGQWHLL